MEQMISEDNLTSDKLEAMATNDNQQKASLFGLPMPTPARAASKPPSIYLPSNLSSTVLYGKYLQFPKDGPEKGVSKNTYLKVWKQLVPHVKVRGLRSDMCNNCDQYSSRIYHCRKK
ncbi:hypothetical protein RvY_15884 [Ramazzottius varieornatus]|uniref:Uncharacterized protein n=1 Tax=Ramazzottius varieornatus TaxID=947166 RepID=A0A1D1W4A7_RAMVA|nr:hypothetical protein RvY_15884 [Ramazzottius varieornatus]